MVGCCGRGLRRPWRLDVDRRLRGWRRSGRGEPVVPQPRTDFPDWAGRDLATAGYTAQILARDGAVRTDVLERQLPLIDRRPALVTITMGGNDLLAAYGDSTAAQSVIDRVAATGEAILSRLRALAADCRIIVTTVYDPSDGAGEVPTAGLPAWPDAPGLVAELNQALTALARRHGAAVADVHRRFLGHGTAAGDPAQSDPRPANPTCGTAA
jgi:lysophospholipase L1-like esterase